MKISFWFLNESKLSFHLKILDSFSYKEEKWWQQESARDALWNSNLPFLQESQTKDSAPACRPKTSGAYKLLKQKWLKKEHTCHLWWSHTSEYMQLDRLSSSPTIYSSRAMIGKSGTIYINFSLSSKICSTLGVGVGMKDGAPKETAEQFWVSIEKVKNVSIQP